MQRNATIYTQPPHCDKIETHLSEINNKFKESIQSLQKNVKSLLVTVKKQNAINSKITKYTVIKPIDNKKVEMKNG